MSTTKIIKRYSNRKLYDTERSCYVTLDEIALMIREGEELKIIDKDSGENLTSVTFAQIIFEAEKKQSFMPIPLLQDLVIRSGDALGEFARTGAQQVQTRASDMRKSAHRLTSDISGKLEKAILRKNDEQQDGDLSAEGFNHEDLSEEELNKDVNDALNTYQKSFELIYGAIQTRINRIREDAPLQNELGSQIEDIRKRLSDLTKRINKLN
ncbi:MAG: polyhydroxyalkanoate synthesis regulator DNA-binding domain-containing protein [Myxococcota bacterium]|jgi:polyhydroxyalkanoate synthesis repressor PhaR|nr:polyhydroxyalkanoate synthesis regulator DNA-binding domain-containing protein [Myxococcota bacterium]